MSLPYFEIIDLFHRKNHLEIYRLSYDRSAKEMMGNECDDHEGQYYRCLSHDGQRQIMIMMIICRVVLNGGQGFTIKRSSSLYKAQHHVIMTILWRSASYDVQHRKMIMII